MRTVSGGTPSAEATTSTVGLSRPKVFRASGVGFSSTVERIRAYWSALMIASAVWTSAAVFSGRVMTQEESGSRDSSVLWPFAFTTRRS